VNIVPVEALGNFVSKEKTDLLQTKSFVQAFLGAVKKSLALGVGLVLLSTAHGSHAASAAELLEKGIYTEETKGELRAATQIYRQIVDDPGADRSLVAQAQLRLGLCELKLGNKPQAISALERLAQEFPDKDKFLALIEQHKNYIQEVDRSELLETALRAIVGKLDVRGGLLRANDMELLNTIEMAQMSGNTNHTFRNFAKANHGIEIADKTRRTPEGWNAKWIIRVDGGRTESKRKKRGPSNEELPKRATAFYLLNAS